MITLADMKNAYSASLEKKGKRQARLRKDALELVRHYSESLGLPAEDTNKTVRTGTQIQPGYHLEKPITEIEIDGYTLNFTITTLIDGDRVNGWFSVTVSIAMCEQDDMLSVKVDDALGPIIVIRDGVHACFSEVVEAIKQATLNKIDKTA